MNSSESVASILTAMFQWTFQWAGSSIVFRAASNEKPGRGAHGSLMSIGKASQLLFA
jgi:hypothetical protein